MALRQTLDGNFMRWHYERAESRFPDLAEDDALNAYGRTSEAEDLFFLNEDGHRCVWRDRVHYFHKKDYRGWKYNEVRIRSIAYLVKPYKVTLATIDRPKSKEATALVKDCSGSGWNLPGDHPRHFSKIPQAVAIDIQVMILELVLTTSSDCILLPSTVLSNMKKSWSPTTYDCNYVHGPYGTHSIWKSVSDKRDRDGECTEYRNVSMKSIDASCLRTNKHFYASGSKLLYRYNSLAFNMRSTHHWRNPGHCFAPTRYYRPMPDTPSNTQPRRREQLIKQGISENEIGHNDT
ncbi:hypothetical protein VTL71DRAFT_3218 [Oculimacula yallundae]|uniref:Uncharacterized protein n=1 Tax=Oculimacula yallundae TaxID=86028 RepID=A0ABR4C6J4_9HELO